MRKYIMLALGFVFLIAAFASRQIITATVGPETNVTSTTGGTEASTDVATPYGVALEDAPDLNANAYALRVFLAHAAGFCLASATAAIAFSNTTYSGVIAYILIAIGAVIMIGLLWSRYTSETFKVGSEATEEQIAKMATTTTTHTVMSVVAGVCVGVAAEAWPNFAG